MSLFIISENYAKMLNIKFMFLGLFVIIALSPVYQIESWD